MAASISVSFVCARARHDHVRGHTVLLQHLCRGHRHRDDAGLGGGVVRPAGQAEDERFRRRVDDAREVKYRVQRVDG